MNLAAFLNLKRVKGQQPEGSSSPGVAVVFCRHEGSSGAPASHPSSFSSPGWDKGPCLLKGKLSSRKRESFFRGWVQSQGVRAPPALQPWSSWKLQGFFIAWDLSFWCRVRLQDSGVDTQLTSPAASGYGRYRYRCWYLSHLPQLQEGWFIFVYRCMPT